MRLSNLTTKLLTSLVVLVLVTGSFAPLTVRAQVNVNPAGDNSGNAALPGYNSTTGLGSTKTVPGSDSTCGGGLTNCLAAMVYYIGPAFATWVASIVAYFFNFVVRLSLNSTAYALNFLTTGWNLALNIANMAFIFILLGIAYTIMLKAETARTMQLLAWVIAIALIVNFSFFATRIVIDAGNILATQFYNAILTQGVPAGNASTPPDITYPLMNALGVQDMMGPKTFSDAQALIGGTDKWGTLAVLTVVFIATAIMLWMIAVSLLMVGVKFLVRVVGLWLVLIFSPVAFVARVSPRTQRGFDMWLKTLVGFSFYPAVFLFMFYILNLFVKDIAGGNLLKSALGQGNDAAQAGANGASAAATSIIANIANVSIRMGFIIVMLYIMLKVADWVMEQSGGLAMNIMNRTSGMLVGGTARLGAFAGRNTVGRAAGLAAESSTLKGKTGIMGNALWRGASALSRSTFDIRNGPAGRTAARGASLLANVNVGKASDRSFAASVDARAKEVEDRAKALKATPVEVRNLQETINRDKAGRITELNKELEQARATGNKQKEDETAAKLKAIGNEGKDKAKINEKERITQLAQRIGGRNVGNLGMPSMGSIKGAAAAMAIAEGKKKKESGTTAASATTPTPTPAAPTPSAPAAAMAAPASHSDDKVVTELKLIRKTIDKMRKQAAEGTLHTAEALRSSTDATAKIGLSIKHGLEDMKADLKAANDNMPPPHGTTPPPAANDNRQAPPPTNDNAADPDAEERRKAA